MSPVTDPAARPALSIVSTLYRSRPFLDDFLRGCLDALKAIDCADYEIVLVNDGSPDDSLDYALQRQADIPHLVVVDLSRNFGHHHAMQAGLAYARGELIFLIDCDLEVPPSVLAEFYRKQRETGGDLIYGYQELRKGGWFEKVSGGSGAGFVLSPPSGFFSGGLAEVENCRLSGLKLASDLPSAEAGAWASAAGGRGSSFERY